MMNLRNFMTAFNIIILIVSMYAATVSNWDDKPWYVYIFQILCWIFIVYNTLEMWTINQNLNTEKQR